LNFRGKTPISTIFHCKNINIAKILPESLKVVVKSSGVPLKSFHVKTFTPKNHLLKQKVAKKQGEVRLALFT